MFLNVPFSVLSESYSLHSYTSQYFPIAIETACEESTVSNLRFLLNPKCLPDWTSA